MITKQLLDLSGQSDRLAGGVGGFNAESVENFGQLAGGEFHVQNRANHLADNALGTGGGGSSSGHK
ncbi:MAG: Uncharacterised protein [Cyanobium sp. ARS6]|nr:MAG: Uncharacterised protein [Cyanobium sp. ARS6]